MSNVCNCISHKDEPSDEELIKRQRDAEADAYDQRLKRLVELMKCLALGVSFGIGGSAVAASGIANGAKAVGVVGCAIGGALTVGSAVMIYSKPHMHNVPAEWRARAKSVCTFSALVMVAAFTFFITMDVIRDARKDRSVPESCIVSDSKFNPSTLRVKN